MLSGTLFTVGLVGVVIRRNMITVLMCIELMLNAVNINLVAFSYRLSSLEGQIFAIFIITVAAGEAAVGLAHHHSALPAAKSDRTSTRRRS